MVVAAGGGVVGDVAGFAAATYLRGVRLVAIPTTLVAQVDSAIGGKTGVNLAEGKNLVGAFYPPKLVIADPATLATLPHREYRSGLYEVIKYGVIADKKLFVFPRKAGCPRYFGATPRLWAILFPRSRSRLKPVWSARDEREGGLRQILNFGHTLGHGLEAATDYRLFLHGEAVAWGMMAATMIALATGRLPLMEAFRIVRLITSVGPLPDVPEIPSAKLRAILAGDKKSRGAAAFDGSFPAILARRNGESKSRGEWSRNSLQQPSGNHGRGAQQDCGRRVKPAKQKINLSGP